LYEGGAGAGKRQQQRDRQLQQGSTARSDTAPAAGAAKPALVLGQYADVKQHYAFDRVLGKGQFGVTRLVVDLATREQCACKSISKRKLVSQEDIEDVRREIKVMHHLSGHPHVVTFKGGEGAAVCLRARGVRRRRRCAWPCWR
jgi:calcium-dependent protein kinase